MAKSVEGGESSWPGFNIGFQNKIYSTNFFPGNREVASAGWRMTRWLNLFFAGYAGCRLLTDSIPERKGMPSFGARISV